MTINFVYVPIYFAMEPMEHTESTNVSRLTLFSRFPLSAER